MNGADAQRSVPGLMPAGPFRPFSKTGLNRQNHFSFNRTQEDGLKQLEQEGARAPFAKLSQRLESAMERPGRLKPSHCSVMQPRPQVSKRG